MSINLLSSVNALFTKDFISKTAAIINEKPEYVKEGITGIIPSVLAVLMQKGTSSEGLDMISKHSKDAVEVKFQSSIAKIITGKNFSKYEKLFDSAEVLFDDKLSDITHKVSINSGLRETSANWLIRLVTPTALGVLGEHIKKNKLSITDAAHVIANEKDAIIDAIPEQYNLTSIFGLSSLKDIGDKFASAVSLPVSVPDIIAEAAPVVPSFIPTFEPEKELETVVEPFVEKETFNHPVVEEVIAEPEPIPEITPIKEEIITIPTPPIVQETNSLLKEQVKEENIKKIIVTSNEPEVVKTDNTTKKSVLKDPAFKWKLISWLLLIALFVILMILFNILPPMFRI